MSNAGQNHKINYVEFITTDVARSKQFYSEVFGWSFEDWGPEYISFSTATAGIDGGFRKGESTATGSPLIVLYASDLAATEKAIIHAGGTITVPTFEFPGGRRFHFADGAGNELAVWSE
jgi:predicted enzyme related to lactoylglutathione lyase